MVSGGCLRLGGSYSIIVGYCWLLLVILGSIKVHLSWAAAAAVAVDLSEIEIQII